MLEYIHKLIAKEITNVKYMAPHITKKNKQG